MLKGFGYGLAAGVVNFGIDTGSNSYEDEMHKGSVDTSDDMDKKDKKNNLIKAVNYLEYTVIIPVVLSLIFNSLLVKFMISLVVLVFPTVIVKSL